MLEDSAAVPETKFEKEIRRELAEIKDSIKQKETEKQQTAAQVG